MLQCLEATLVFRRRADGDADPFRQLITAHWTHNHTLRLQRLENAQAVADSNQDEIRERRDEFEFPFAKCPLKKFQPGEIVRAGFADVLNVIQRGCRLVDRLVVGVGDNPENDGCSKISVRR